MAVVRSSILPIRIATPAPRIVEPELDMDRLGRQPLAAVSIIRELIGKLVPTGPWVMRSPMRSIAREIEEVWPSTEL